MEWQVQHYSVCSWASHHGDAWPGIAMANLSQEGRWLRSEQVINDYLRFWFRGGGGPRRYTFWAAHAAYNRFLVNKNSSYLLVMSRAPVICSFVQDLMPDLLENVRQWQETHTVNNYSCFWQSDGKNISPEYKVSSSG